MSSSFKRVLPFVAAAAVLGAGVGGAEVRKQQEMGKLPAPVATGTDSRTLLASTDPTTGVGEGEYFYRLLELIKREFVEPVEDEQKLAEGAVRGMVNSLSDPNATFMSAEHFPSYQRAQKGEVEGIGIQVQLNFDPEQLKKFHATQDKLAEWNEKGRKEVDGKLEELPDIQPGALIPDIVVSAVFPGSPAEQAGIKPGDLIDGVDGKWSLNRREVTELNAAFELIRQNKMDRQKYLDLRKKYMDRSEHAISPGRVRQKLSIGETGSIKVTWKSPAGNVQSANLVKRVTKLSPLMGDQLRFMPGSESAAKQAISGGSTRFDLRNSGPGDFNEAVNLLSALLPKGEYGVVRSDRNQRKAPFKLDGPGQDFKPLVLVVDETTLGASRLFAHVLVSAGRATLEGSMGGSPTYIFDTVELPTGAGYVIPTGIFEGKENKS